jgi:hypothetical protein
MKGWAPLSVFACLMSPLRALKDLQLRQTAEASATEGQVHTHAHTSVVLCYWHNAAQKTIVRKGDAVSRVSSLCLRTKSTWKFKKISLGAWLIFLWSLQLN